MTLKVRRETYSQGLSFPLSGAAPGMSLFSKPQLACWNCPSHHATLQKQSDFTVKVFTVLQSQPPCPCAWQDRVFGRTVCADCHFELWLWLALVLTPYPWSTLHVNWPAFQCRWTLGLGFVPVFLRRPLSLCKICATSRHSKPAWKHKAVFRSGILDWRWFLPFKQWMEMVFLVPVQETNCCWHLIIAG